MEPRIHHRLGRRPGLEITPEGYILIRKLAAVFQSHRRNSPSCFIFSKPARPGSPHVSLVFWAVPVGTRHASPRRAGSLARCVHLGGPSREWGLQKKKNPVKLSTETAVALSLRLKVAAEEDKVYEKAPSLPQTGNASSLKARRRAGGPGALGPEGAAVRAVRAGAWAGRVESAPFLIFQAIHQMPVTLGPNS